MKVTLEESKTYKNFYGEKLYDDDDPSEILEANTNISLFGARGYIGWIGVTVGLEINLEYAYNMILQHQQH